MPSNMKLDICEASHGIRATASPVTLTQSGPERVTHNNNNMWMYDNSGYLVRVHKRTWKDLYTPDAQCPVPEAQPDNCRRTIAFKPDGTLEDFEDKYKDLPQQQKNRSFAGPAWSGETWFKAKEANKTSSTAAAQSTNSDSNTKSVSNQSNGTAAAATRTAAYRISSPTPRTETSGTTSGTTTAKEATSISRKSSSRTKGHTSNNRLLDQGRAIQ